jgi:hypothetical protein
MLAAAVTPAKRAPATVMYQRDEIEVGQAATELQCDSAQTFFFV